MSSDASHAKGIYEQILTGERIKVRGLSSRKEFENLRTRLCALHRHTRYLLELTDESICADFTAAEGFGVFWLGAPRRRQNVKYEIEILADVGSDQQEQQDGQV